MLQRCSTIAPIPRQQSPKSRAGSVEVKVGNLAAACRAKIEMSFNLSAYQPHLAGGCASQGVGI